MTDDLGLFGRTDDPPAPRSDGRGARRRAREVQDSQRRRRRRIVLTVTLVVLILALSASIYGVRALIKLREVPDYAGPGGAEMILQVNDGESLSQIGTTLFSHDGVASVKAFTRAAESDRRIRSVQPGYYQVRARMSGAAAVERLLDPSARVGRLEIRGGEQLDDVGLPNATTAPGLLTALSRASCAMIAGTSTCVSPAQLRATMAETDPAQLGVPNWVADPMARVDPQRRLEGLLMPGTYDVRPGSSAPELLKQVTDKSVTRLLAGGLPNSAAGTGYSPYEVLIIASIIEREAIGPDFGRVARVIYNRLAAGMQLQMDSTINYTLDRPQVRTFPVDRDRPGPYNTYVNKGLPVAPIGAPSTAAVEAAAHPDPGAWQYFVKCQMDGTSCFSVTIQEHEAAVNDAVARGVF